MYNLYQVIWKHSQATTRAIQESGKIRIGKKIKFNSETKRN